MTHEEVIQILKEIREDCSEAHSCDGCPYLNKKTEMCMIRGLPDEWDLEVDE